MVSLVADIVIKSRNEHQIPSHTRRNAVSHRQTITWVLYTSTLALKSRIFKIIHLRDIIIDYLI